jgi:hypothetical protein
MALYEINDQMKGWLLEFLGRTPIQGREAMIMVQIDQALGRPVQQERKEQISETDQSDPKEN